MLSNKHVWTCHRKRPTSLTKLRSCLGLLTNRDNFRNIFRSTKYVPKIVTIFERLETSLIEKLWKDQLSKLKTLYDEEMRSMNQLKNLLFSPQVLTLANRIGHVTLDMDACTFHVRCLLMQQQENRTTKSNRNRSGLLSKLSKSLIK